MLKEILSDSIGIALFYDWVFKSFQRTTETLFVSGRDFAGLWLTRGTCVARSDSARQRQYAHSRGNMLSLSY